MHFRSALIIGSSPDAPRIVDFVKPAGMALVPINNAWRLRDANSGYGAAETDWDVAVIAGDMPVERRPLSLLPGQRLCLDDEYVQGVNAFGGMVFCGATMAFNACYWTMHALGVGLVGVLGCDMVYSQGTTAASHFYGVGTPDPLRVNITLRDLEAKYARVMVRAQRRGTLCVNLSSLDQSRCTFPRVDLENFTALSMQPTTAILKQVLDDRKYPAVRKLARAASELERGAPFDRVDHRYWTYRKLIDVRLVDRVDDIWREAGLVLADILNRVLKESRNASKHA